MIRLRDGILAETAAPVLGTSRLSAGECDRAYATRALSAPPPGFTDVARGSASRPRRILDLGESLHRAIIGTCPTTDDLCRMIRKPGAGAPDTSGHAPHGIAIGLKAKRGVGSKLLGSALDERHRGTFRRFMAARDTAGLRATWRKAMAAREISGAHRIASTDAATDSAPISDMRMLSHLMGAANRAGIRCLAEQDRAIAASRDAMACQQPRGSSARRRGVWRRTAAPRCATGAAPLPGLSGAPASAFYRSTASATTRLRHEAAVPSR